MGAYLTSKALEAWNFGTLAQRLHAQNYERFLTNSYLQVGSLVPAGLILVAYVVLVRRWSRLAIVCLALYAFTTMVFFNLHYVHTYYAYSSAIFLVIALGILISGIIALPGWKAWVGVGLVALELFAFVRAYRDVFYPLQHGNFAGLADAAALVDRTTSKNDVILITGLKWSSELPYQSHRRAVTDADVGVSNQPEDLGPFGRELQEESPQTITEVVACGDGRNTDRLREILQTVDIAPSTPLHADDCDIYRRHADSQATATPPGGRLLNSTSTR